MSSHSPVVGDNELNKSWFLTRFVVSSVGLHIRIRAQVSWPNWSRGNHDSPNLTKNHSDLLIPRLLVEPCWWSSHSIFTSSSQVHHWRHRPWFIDWMVRELRFGILSRSEHKCSTSSTSKLASHHVVFNWLNSPWFEVTPNGKLGRLWFVSPN